MIAIAGVWRFNGDPTGYIVNLDELDEAFDAAVGERLGHHLRQQRRRWRR